jgi:hypothetical protein
MAMRSASVSCFDIVRDGGVTKKNWEKTKGERWQKAATTESSKEEKGRLTKEKGGAKEKGMEGSLIDGEQKR